MEKLEKDVVVPSPLKQEFFKLICQQHFLKMNERPTRQAPGMPEYQQQVCYLLLRKTRRIFWTLKSLNSQLLQLNRTATKRKHDIG